MLFDDYTHPDHPGVGEAIDELGLRGERRGTLFVHRHQMPQRRVNVQRLSTERSGGGRFARRPRRPLPSVRRYLAGKASKGDSRCEHGRTPGIGTWWLAGRWPCCARLRWPGRLRSGGAQTLTSTPAAGGAGHYVGFCLGAYLAGSNPGMGLLAPGDTDEHDHTRSALVTSAAEGVIRVCWGRAVRYQYAQDPPYVIPFGTGGEQVLSRFTNHEINALVRPYQHRSVGVVGTHSEADRSWYTTRLWHSDHDDAQGLQLITAVMKA